MKSASPEQQAQVEVLMQEFIADVDRLYFLMNKLKKNRALILQILDEIERDEKHHE